MNSNMTTTVLQSFMANTDIELVNMLQSSCSLIATIIILLKLFDVSSIFRSVRERRAKMRKEKDQKEMLRLKKMFEKLNNTKIDVDITLSSDDEEIDAGNIMPIARKKKAKMEEKV